MFSISSTSLPSHDALTVLPLKHFRFFFSLQRLKADSVGSLNLFPRDTYYNQAGTVIRHPGFHTWMQKTVRWRGEMLSKPPKIMCVAYKKAGKPRVGRRRLYRPLKQGLKARNGGSGATGDSTLLVGWNFCYGRTTRRAPTLAMPRNVRCRPLRGKQSKNIRWLLFTLRCAKYNQSRINLHEVCKFQPGPFGLNKPHGQHGIPSWDFSIFHLDVCTFIKWGSEFRLLKIWLEFHVLWHSWTFPFHAILSRGSFSGYCRCALVT
jgi:hypothetical protein